MGIHTNKQFNKLKVYFKLYSFKLFLGNVCFVRENHDVIREFQYTQILRANLRLIPDFAYLSETFLRHTKVLDKDWNTIEIE